MQRRKVTDEMVERGLEYVKVAGGWPTHYGENPVRRLLEAAINPEPAEPEIEVTPPMWEAARKFLRPILNRIGLSEPSSLYFSNLDLAALYGAMEAERRKGANSCPKVRHHQRKKDGSWICAHRRKDDP